MKRMGFIGLGNIGKPMALHWAKSDDFELTVYDVFPEAAKEFSELGCEVAVDIKAMASAGDVIGICVRNDADVESLVYGDFCST